MVRFYYFPAIGLYKRHAPRSIVNGLRDEDDDADGYANRASFASEYSLRENAGDGVQVFFKEHGRKGSSSSFLPRKKITAKSRPETKVC